MGLMVTMKGMTGKKFERAYFTTVVVSLKVAGNIVEQTWVIL